MHWIFFALIAAALIMLLLLGRLKAKIDSAGRREYAVRIYFCGIRLLVLRVIPEFEGYIRPKLIIYCGKRKKLRRERRKNILIGFAVTDIADDMVGHGIICGKRGDRLPG